MKHSRLVVALLLVLGACGDDSASTTTAPATTSAPAATVATTTTPTTSATTLPPTTLPPTTLPPTTLPPTTAAPTTTAPTTTSAPATTVAGSPFTSATYGFFPAPLGTADDGHGSGCIHAPGTLTDGMWFGFVEAVGGGSVTFDMACFFTGAAGVAAATADGEVGYELDFYIRNMNPATYSVPLDMAGTAYWLELTGDLTPQPIPMPNWPIPWDPNYQVCPADHCSVWLYVNGGVVTELIEQYLP